MKATIWSRLSRIARIGAGGGANNYCEELLTETPDQARSGWSGRPEPNELGSVVIKCSAAGYPRPELGNVDAVWV